MRYFEKYSLKQEGSENRKTKKFMPKNTVGSQLIGGDAAPCSDKERRLRQIEASVKMNANNMGKLFSFFTREQLKSPGITQPETDDEKTN